MKGLFLNGFYSAVGNIKLFLFVVIASGIALLITGNPTVQELFIYISITALSINGISGLRKDAASKWNRYEITLPIRRSGIIKCKFLNYLFWVLVGTIIALIVTATTVLIHANWNDFLLNIEGFASMLALGIGISLITGAVFYPMAYLLGTEKSETLLIISLLSAIGLSILAITFLNCFSILSSPLRIVIFVAFYILMFFVSYLTTVHIFAKKEF